MTWLSVMLLWWIVRLPMVILEPGDRVLVAVPSDADRREAHQLHEHLAQQFPGVMFVVLVGVDSVTVAPGDDIDGEVVEAEIIGEVP